MCIHKHSLHLIAIILRLGDIYMHDTSINRYPHRCVIDMVRGIGWTAWVWSLRRHKGCSLETMVSEYILYIV